MFDCLRLGRSMLCAKPGAGLICSMAQRVELEVLACSLSFNLRSCQQCLSLVLKL